MTILFLCGSLEPAHDGVGDYTRRLAGELMRQGHTVALLSLNDKGLADADEREFPQTDNGQLIPTLRLSKRLSWRDRTYRAGHFIDAVRPDVVSLQYVPFSFQDKGLPVGLPGVLTQLRRGCPLHIMFHELWVGIQAQSPRRHIGWGYVQRHLIGSMLTEQQPTLIHTHTPLYQFELRHLGVQAAHLPLFSNIPVHSAPAEQPAASGQLRFVLFGGAFPGAPVQAFARDVAMYARTKQVEASLTLVGRNGAEQHTWTDAWQSHNLTVQNLGEQPPEVISSVLSQATLGVSTTPVALWHKSGAIAAMHAHGIPVCCASAPWQPRRPVTLPQTNGILDYQPGNLVALLDRQPLAPPAGISLTSVAQQLTTELTRALRPALAQATYSL